jgi:hypothetical protein
MSLETSQSLENTITETNSYQGCVAVFHLDFKNQMVNHDVEKALEASVLFSKLANQVLFELIDKEHETRLNQFLRVNQDSGAVTIRTVGHRVEDVRALLIYAGKLFGACLLNGILINGAISYGSVYLDSQSTIFAAKALQLADALCQETVWFGLVLEDSLAYCFEDRPAYESTIQDIEYNHFKIISLYDIPCSGYTLNSSIKYRHVVINWPIMVDNFSVRFKSLSMEQFYQEFSDRYGAFKTQSHRFKSRFLHTYDFLQDSVNRQP